MLNLLKLLWKCSSIERHREYNSHFTEKKTFVNSLQVVISVAKLILFLNDYSIFPLSSQQVSSKIVLLNIFNISSVSLPPFACRSLCLKQHALLWLVKWNQVRCFCEVWSPSTSYCVVNTPNIEQRLIEIHSVVCFFGI